MSAIDDAARKLSKNCGHVSLPPLVCDDCRGNILRTAQNAWPAELAAAAREQNTRMSEELVKAHSDSEQEAVHRAGLHEKIRKMEERYVAMVGEAGKLRARISDLEAQLKAEVAVATYRKTAEKAAEVESKRRAAITGAHKA